MSLDREDLSNDLYKIIDKLQAEIKLRSESEKLFATKIVPDLKTEAQIKIVAAYNLGHISGLKEGRRESRDAR